MSAGIEVNAPEDVPESNPPLKKNDAASRSRSAPQPRSHPLKKFLEHDGQILRYNILWCIKKKKAERYIYHIKENSIPLKKKRHSCDLHKTAATFLLFFFKKTDLVACGTGAKKRAYRWMNG